MVRIFRKVFQASGRFAFNWREFLFKLFLCLCSLAANERQTPEFFFFFECLHIYVPIFNTNKHFLNDYSIYAFYTLFSLTLLGNYFFYNLARSYY